MAPAGPVLRSLPGAVMSKYWSELVRGLSPYVPGEQPKLTNLVKLNTNENPYPPSPAVLEAIRAEVGEGLRRYPDPTSARLVEAAARFYGVPSEFVFAGNGSDEVLAHVFHAFFGRPGEVLFPDVTYSFYPVYAALYRLPYRQIPLDDSLGICLADYVGPNAGIIFPNPNAPTSRALPLSELEELLARNTESVVVVDEAYVDFGAESAVQLTLRYPQLLVTQTLSKSRSLAGLRVGVAVGQPHLIEALVRVKDSFNSYPLDRLAIVGGAAAFDDVDYFERTRQAVIAHRQALTAALVERGFHVLPSAANFVFAQHPEHDAGELTRKLREEAVIVRHFKQPRIAQYLRITVGLPEENARLLSALDAVLS
jgi:histidinol-phosphate aminotransferase